MPRGLLIAVAVLALLGGGIWWADKHPKTDDAKKAPDAAPKILNIPDNQISEIRVVKPGADTVAIARLGDRWEITQPKAMPADQDAMSSMTGTVATLTGDRMIDEKPASLTPFGLDHPVEQVEIRRKDGKTDTLLFGLDTPTGGNVFAKLANSSTVYTLPASSKSNFEKSVNDLRDKRLLTFNNDKVTSVTLTPAKGGAIEFAKNGQSEWQIVKPKTYRADNLPVDDLVRKLKDAKMDVNATGDNAKAFGSAAKVATVAVTDNSGTQSMEIRKGADKAFFAKSTAVEGIFKITGDVGDGLDKSVDDFRNKKLFDFGFSDPTKLDLSGVVYERSAAKWNSGGKEFDGPSLQAVLDKLRDLSATKFTEKISGAQTLSVGVTYGDQKRTEKVVINKSADGYEAQRDGEPSVYVLEAKNVDELTKAISGIKPAQAASKSVKKK